MVYFCYHLSSEFDLRHKLVKNQFKLKESLVNLNILNVMLSYWALFLGQWWCQLNVWKLVLFYAKCLIGSLFLHFRATDLSWFCVFKKCAFTVTVRSLLFWNFIQAVCGIAMGGHVVVYFSKCSILNKPSWEILQIYKRGNFPWEFMS